MSPATSDPKGSPTPPRVFAVLSIHAGGVEELELALARLQDFDCLGSEEPNPSSLRAYFAPGTELGPVVRALTRIGTGIRCRIEPDIPERDWLAEWKEALEGFELGRGYFVVPTWREPPATDRRVLTIDPEQAFGTGTHETTALEVELLEEYVRPGDRVIDVGTGTGILAMVAVCQGAREVLAIESDPEAARCAVRNIARNGLDASITVRRSRLEELETLHADIVVANIQANVLRDAVHRMRGRILLSGILDDEADGFVAELPEDTTLVSKRRRGEWVALALERPKDAARA